MIIYVAIIRSVTTQFVITYIIYVAIIAPVLPKLDVHQLAVVSGASYYNCVVYVNNLIIIRLLS